MERTGFSDHLEPFGTVPTAVGTKGRQRTKGKGKNNALGTVETQRKAVKGRAVALTGDVGAVEEVLRAALGRAALLRAGADLMMMMMMMMMCAGGHGDDDLELMSGGVTHRKPCCPTNSSGILLNSSSVSGPPAGASR